MRECAANLIRLNCSLSMALAFGAGWYVFGRWLTSPFLPVPAGLYTLTLTLASYTPDRRSATVRANEVARVADVRLHAVDPVVVPIGASGGSVTNSLGNTSLEFPPGAVSTTQQARVTYLPNDALPGTSRIGGPK